MAQPQNFLQLGKNVSDAEDATHRYVEAVSLLLRPRDMLNRTKDDVGLSACWVVVQTERRCQRVAANFHRRLAPLDPVGSH